MKLSHMEGLSVEFAIQVNQQREELREECAAYQPPTTCVLYQVVVTNFQLPVKHHGCEAYADTLTLKHHGHQHFLTLYTL